MRSGFKLAEDQAAGKLLLVSKSSTKMGLRQAPSDPHSHPTWMLNSNSGMLNSGPF